MKYSREPIYHLTSSFTLVFPRREAVDNDTPSNNAAWVRSEYSRGRSKGGQMLQEMMHMLSCLKLNLRRQCSTAAFPRNLGLAFRSRSWGKKAGKRRSRFFPPSSFVSFRDKSFTSHIPTQPPLTSCCLCVSRQTRVGQPRTCQISQR